MLKILSLSIMTSTALFITACGDVEDTYTPPKNPSQSSTTYISGKATLASVSGSLATACLDTNYNKACDTDEPSTTVDNEGTFTLSTQSNVENGMLIIVENGYNIIPFKDKNDTLSRNLKFYKSYQSTDGKQNVNIVSTLIAKQLQHNGDSNYQLAVSDFTNLYPNYIDPENSWFDARISKNDLTLDPIDEAAAWFFNWIGGDEELLKFNAALQTIVSNDNTINIQTRSSSRAPVQENDLPEESALDEFYNTSGAFFTELLGFMEEFINWISSVGDNEGTGTRPDPDTPVPEDTKPTVPLVLEIQRGNLNGVWFIIDASGDRTCSDIRSNDEIAVTEADGKTTNLSLTFNNSKKTMLLKLGFFTADTIKFDKYYDNETFTGNYESDGETLKGFKILPSNDIKDPLDACIHDTDKLGL